MTSRILTLIACVLVALPQRVCVCAGETYACTGKSCAAMPAPPKEPERTRCSCKHRHDTPAPAPPEAVAQAPTESDGPAAPHEHKRHQSHSPAVADAGDAPCPCPSLTPVPPADANDHGLLLIETAGGAVAPRLAMEPPPGGPPRHILLQVFRN